MHRNTRRQGGFTFVELLVVITIIGMLMALLLPAVNASVEAARQASCKNKQNQLALALISFECQNNRFPGYNETVGGNVHSWVVPIWPYTDHHDWYFEFQNGANNARYAELFNECSTTTCSVSSQFVQTGIDETERLNKCVDNVFAETRAPQPHDRLVSLSDR